jgi:YVTN family beta-propeller protein
MRTCGKRQVLLAVVAAVALSHPANGQAPTPPPTPPPLRLPLTSVIPEATIETAGDWALAATPDGVWVSNRTAGTMARIDPKTNVLGAAIAVGKQPCHPAVSAFKQMWTALCGTPGLARFDGLSEKAEKTPDVISTGRRAAGPVATGTGSIWMITDTAGTLSRIDPDTNAVVAEVTVPAGAGALVFGLDAVWVASSTRDLVTRVNGHTNVVVEAIKVGRSPVSIAIGEGSVWTLNSGDGTVTRIDPKTNKVIETIKAGVMGSNGTIVVGEGSVWLSARGAPLTRIDPATNTVRQQFSGPGGGALAIGAKSLWLAATPTAVWRIDPRRVEATRK